MDNASVGAPVGKQGIDDHDVVSCSEGRLGHPVGCEVLLA